MLDGRSPSKWRDWCLSNCFSTSTKASDRLEAVAGRLVLAPSVPHLLSGPRAHPSRRPYRPSTSLCLPRDRAQSQEAANGVNRPGSSFGPGTVANVLVAAREEKPLLKDAGLFARKAPRVELVSRDEPLARQEDRSNVAAFLLPQSSN